MRVINISRFGHETSCVCTLACWSIHCWAPFLSQYWGHCCLVVFESRLDSETSEDRLIRWIEGRCNTQDNLINGHDQAFIEETAEPCCSDESAQGSSSLESQYAQDSQIRAICAKFSKKERKSSQCHQSWQYYARRLVNSQSKLTRSRWPRPKVYHRLLDSPPFAMLR